MFSAPFCQQSAAEGIAYDRAKVLDVQADDAERWDAKKKKKHNPDKGFSGTRGNHGNHDKESERNVIV